MDRWRPHATSRCASSSALESRPPSSFSPASRASACSTGTTGRDLDNLSLTAPGVGIWAFTTTYMEHYQPVAWLLWAAVSNAGGSATALHVVNLVAHAAAAVLVFSCPGGFSRWLHPSAWRRRCRIWRR
ncbi:MAG: hypothetical protein R2712_30815 [Vicinamibacterales bacterium]